MRPVISEPDGSVQEPGDAPASGQEPELAMDECGLDTGWEGDEYCILPPPPDKGFQIHIGPSDYDNPEPEYVMQPGTEDVVTMNATSGNTSDVFYYRRQYRMRPGSHHIIVSMGGGLGGRRLGGTQNLAKDNPTGPTPPENEDVGLPLPAHSQLSVNMHYYNFGQKPILKEVWVNFWYKEPDSVKQPASEVFSFTGVNAAVAHSHVVVGASCPITEPGRILSLYGHRHYNNVRFTAWRVRGDQRDVLLEDFDAVHPAVLEFNSVTENPPYMPGMKRLGGWSGMLDLMPGDKLDFECEIINNTNKDFTGANEANDDEMCILIGDTVGTQIPGFCTPIPARNVE
jgi:hypothetical protein